MSALEAASSARPRDHIDDALECIASGPRHSLFDPRLKRYRKLGEIAYVHGMQGAQFTVDRLDEDGLHTEAAKIALILRNAKDGTVSLHPYHFRLAQQIADKELGFYDCYGNSLVYFTHDDLKKKLKPIEKAPLLFIPKADPVPPVTQAGSLSKTIAVAQQNLDPAAPRRSVSGLEVEEVERPDAAQTEKKQEESSWSRFLAALLYIIMVVALIAIAILL